MTGYGVINILRTVNYTTSVHAELKLSKIQEISLVTSIFSGIASSKEHRFWGQTDRLSNQDELCL